MIPDDLSTSRRLSAEQNAVEASEKNKTMAASTQIRMYLGAKTLCKYDINLSIINIAGLPPSLPRDLHEICFAEYYGYDQNGAYN